MTGTLLDDDYMSDNSSTGALLGEYTAREPSDIKIPESFLKKIEQERSRLTKLTRSRPVKKVRFDIDKYSDLDKYRDLSRAIFITKKEMSADYPL